MIQMPSELSKLEGGAPSPPVSSYGRTHPAHLTVRKHGGHTIIVFLTVCTRGRKTILARGDAMTVLREAWAKATLWQLGGWVLMPDHAHLFCAPTTVPPAALERWVGYWKSEAARHWPRSAECPLWQRDFWDTQLRQSDSYLAKWKYVRENPVRKGLVDRSESWPFQGEENPLWWRG